MKILTIVIPSYNTEKFIHENMKTFLHPDLYKDVEILLIDDGSTDTTAQNIRKYQEKYPDYIRAISKENGHHGSVINRGIAEATGKYFKVIDADDWVDTKNLIAFVKFLKRTESDLVVNPYIMIHQITRETQNICIYSGIEYRRNYRISALLNQNITKLKIHAVTFRTEILKKNAIRVTEKCFYDDFQYWLYPVCYVRSVIFFEKPVYYYLIGQKSQSISNESAFKNVGMSMKIYEDAVQWYNYIQILRKKNHFAFECFSKMLMLYKIITKSEGR